MKQNTRKPRKGIVRTPYENIFFTVKWADINEPSEENKKAYEKMNTPKIKLLNRC